MTPQPSWVPVLIVLPTLVPIIAAASTDDWSQAPRLSASEWNGATPPGTGTSNAVEDTPSMVIAP